MEDDDVIFFVCDAFSLCCRCVKQWKSKKNQEIEKLGWKMGFVGGIQKELMLTGVAFKWPRKFQEIFAYEYRHLSSGSFNYFCILKRWPLNSKKMKKEEILIFRVLKSTLPN